MATAILLIATNGLYRTQWKCSHHATATTSSPICPIISKNKSQSQSEKMQCEWAFTYIVLSSASRVLSHWPKPRKNPTPTPSIHIVSAESRWVWLNPNEATLVQIQHKVRKALFTLTKTDFETSLFRSQSLPVWTQRFTLNGDFWKWLESDSNYKIPLLCSQLMYTGSRLERANTCKENCSL